MTTRPVDIPTWATNELYASVGDSWDTDPTKVEPSAGRKAEGWEPTQLPPAEFMNWMMNRYGRWFEYLRDIEWLNWQSADLTMSGIGALSGLRMVAMGWDANGATTGEMWVMTFTSASATQKIATSRDGLTWLIRTHPSAGAVLHPKGLIYSPTASLWIASMDGSGATAIMTSPDGVNWTARTDPDASSNRYGMADNGSIIVMCRASSLGFLSSTDGITWTARANPATGTMRAVAWSSTLSLFAAVGTLGDIVTSTNGTTWTDRSAGSPTANQFIDIVWDATAGVFIAVTSTGDVVTSPDGISWTDRGTQLKNTNGAVAGITGIAGDGAGNVLICGSGTADECVVAHSNDGGVVWRQSRLTIPDGPIEPTGIRYENLRWVLFGATPSTVALDPMYAFSLKVTP